MGDWTQQAPCRDHADLMTDATTDTQVAAAVAICAGCPYVDACLDLLATTSPGDTADVTRGIVAGGLTGPALGKELRRRAPRGLKPIVHGTENGARTHYRRGEKPCDACRVAAAVAKNPDAYATRQRWAS